MYLVDTSVWIDYFCGRKTDASKYFNKILDQNLPYGITSIIYQEVIQGANSQQDFNKLDAYLRTQRFFHPKHDQLSYQASAELFFDCRRKGITIRSTIDCLIAQIAIEHRLILLHNDKDYREIGKVAVELEQIHLSKKL